jgi:tripartite-type tricarboxylate transporter receptor subunit TctC
MLRHPGREALAGRAQHPDPPQAIVEKFSKALGEAAKAPDVADKLVTSGNYPSYLEPAAFRETIARENQSFGEIIKKADIKI